MKLWSTQELADEAGVSRRYVSRLCKQGVIPAQKAGDNWIIFDDDARAWLATRPQEPEESTPDE